MVSTAEETTYSTGRAVVGDTAPLVLGIIVSRASGCGHAPVVGIAIVASAVFVKISGAILLSAKVLEHLEKE